MRFKNMFSIGTMLVALGLTGCASKQNTEDLLALELAKRAKLLSEMLPKNSLSESTVKPRDFCSKLTENNLCSTSANLDNGFLSDPAFQKGGRLHEKTGTWVSVINRMRKTYHFGSIETFSNFPVVQTLNHIDPEKKKTSINILYPAAGDHIAPLQLSYAIQSQIPRIKQVNFRYNEISQKTEDSLEYQIKELEKEGFITELIVSREEHSELKPPYTTEPFDTVAFGDTHKPKKIIPHITTYTFNIKTRKGEYKTQIQYAVAMSGEQFFTAKDACNADIFLNHRSIYPGRGEGKFVYSKRKCDPSSKAVLIGKAFIQGRLYGNFTQMNGPSLFVVGTQGSFSEKNCSIKTKFDTSCPVLHFIDKDTYFAAQN